MLGRSDGVLKPGGVRFGSSEIYNVLSRHFRDVEDGLCIGRRREHDSDETVVLFVKMTQGKQLSGALKHSINECIRSDLSARHVPGIIDEVRARNGLKWKKLMIVVPNRRQKSR